MNQKIVSSFVCFLAFALVNCANCDQTDLEYTDIEDTEPSEPANVPEEPSPDEPPATTLVIGGITQLSDANAEQPEATASSSVASSSSTSVMSSSSPGSSSSSSSTASSSAAASASSSSTGGNSSSTGPAPDVCLPSAQLPESVLTTAEFPMPANDPCFATNAPLAYALWDESSDVATSFGASDAALNFHVKACGEFELWYVRLTLTPRNSTIRTNPTVADVRYSWIDGTQRYVGIERQTTETHVATSGQQSYLVYLPHFYGHAPDMCVPLLHCGNTSCAFRLSLTMAPGTSREDYDLSVAAIGRQRSTEQPLDAFGLFGQPRHLIITSP